MEPIEALGPVVSIVVIIFIAIFVILWLFLPFVVYGIQTQATKIHYLAIENNKIQRQNSAILAKLLDEAERRYYENFFLAMLGELKKNNDSQKNTAEILAKLLDEVKPNNNNK